MVFISVKRFIKSHDQNNIKSHYTVTLSVEENHCLSYYSIKLYKGNLNTSCHKTLLQYSSFMITLLERQCYEGEVQPDRKMDHTPSIYINSSDLPIFLALCYSHFFGSATRF